MAVEEKNKKSLGTPCATASIRIDALNHSFCRGKDGELEEILDYTEDYNKY